MIRNLSEFSFFYQINMHRRDEWKKTGGYDGPDIPRKFFMNKSNTYMFMDYLNIPHPDVLYSGTLSSETFDVLEDGAYFIKPEIGHSGKGVVSFRKAGRKIRAFNDELSAIEFIKTYSEGPGDQRYVIERMVEDYEGGPLYEFKGYFFYGTGVDHILCIRRGSNGAKRYQQLDPNGKEVFTGKYVNSREDLGIKKERYLKIVKFIESVGRNIPLSFCRIDVYDTSEGPVVGELTPCPGENRNLTIWYDNYLGRKIENGRRYLAQDILDNKVVAYDEVVKNKWFLIV